MGPHSCSGVLSGWSANVYVYDMEHIRPTWPLRRAGHVRAPLNLVDTQ